MEDERIQFLYNNIILLCQPKENENILKQLTKSRAVRDFLDDTQTLSLVAIELESKEYYFTCNLAEQQFNTNNIFDILFVKRSNELLTNSNIRQNIDIHTIKGTPTMNLLNTLKGIWCPAFLTNPELSDSLPPRVKQLLSELETTLSASVMNLTSTSRSMNQNDANNISGIRTFQEELTFWYHFKDRNYSKAIEQILIEIQGFNDIKSLDLTSLLELIDLSFDTFNNLWNYRSTTNDNHTYNQTRMIHLFDCIGLEIFQYIQYYLANLTLWDFQSSKNMMKLQNAIHIIDQWLDIPKKLISNYWSISSSKKWDKNIPYLNTFLLHFQQRLYQILSLLSLLNEVNNVFVRNQTMNGPSNPSNQSSNNGNNTSTRVLPNQFQRLYEPFESLNPIFYNPYTSNQWEIMIKNFYTQFQQIYESEIILLLQKTFGMYLKQPDLLFHEMNAYPVLLSRTSIQNALINEREIILTLIKDEMRSIESKIDNDELLLSNQLTSSTKKTNLSQQERMMSSMLGGISTSVLVGNIIKLKQFEKKCLIFQQCMVSLLQSLRNTEAIVQQNESLLYKIQSEINIRYKHWLEDMENKLLNSSSDNDSSSLRLSGPLLTWKEGILVVNFPDDLVQFTRDYRQLDELGFDVPKPSQSSTSNRRQNRNNSSTGSGKGSVTLGDCVIEAEKYYRFGILLKKTANFYNSISDQMIDIQEQLLLGSLTSFANLVSSSTNVNSTHLTWQYPSECEEFITTLQHAVQKLSQENRILRKLHEYFITSMLQLMQIDLLRNQDQWKMKWKQMKEKYIAGIVQVYDNKDIVLYTNHWNYQIYKTLEISYQFGLENILENIMEIKVELLYTNKALEFKPNIESIRQSYYRELKKFIMIPFVFEGFPMNSINNNANGGNGNGNRTTKSSSKSGNVVINNNLTSIFKKMIYRNSSQIISIYLKSERLFDKLTDIMNVYQTYFFLVNIPDLENYLEQQLQTSSEFIINLKLFKNKRKEVEKLPDYIKYHCLSINLLPMKQYLDDFYQHYQHYLLILLRKKLFEQIKLIEFFLDNAQEQLHQKPHTIEEIALCKKQWKDISTQKADYWNKYIQCQEMKQVLLSSLSNTLPLDISELLTRMGAMDGEGGKWDDLDILLETYHDILEKEKESLKIYLEEEEINLNIEITKFLTKWKTIRPTEVTRRSSTSSDNNNNELRDNINNIFQTLQEWNTLFQDLETRITKHIEARQVFGMVNPRFETLDTLQADIVQTMKAWDILKQYLTEEDQIGNEDWLSFTNIYILQDFANNWGENIKNQRNTTSNTKDGNTTTKDGLSGFESIIEYILNITEKIKKSIPALKYCKSDAFKEDHWNELLQGKLQFSKEIKITNMKVSHFLSKLDLLIDPTMLSYVKNLQVRAIGEVTIREGMAELRTWELSAEIPLLLPQDNTANINIPLIKDYKDLFLQISDKQTLLNTLKESPFFKAFSDIGLIFEQKLIQVDTIIHLLHQIQRKWIYLEPIFSKHSLPNHEEIKFKKSNDVYQEMMINMIKANKLFYLLDDMYFPKLHSQCQIILDQFERCQKALSEYLEMKRSLMPRFYFIGDDDLLELLGQSTNQNIITLHLKKLFQGIYKIQFVEDPNNKSQFQIKAMISQANEVVTLVNSVSIQDSIEVWLEKLANEMRHTLSSMLQQSLSSKNKGLDWNLPSQIICLSHNIQFTKQIEDIFNNSSNTSQLHNQLQQYQQQLQQELFDNTSHDLSNEPLLQLKMKSLVFDLVHNIDVINQLLNKNISKSSDWIWSKQLRYYQDGNKTVVRMHDAEFEYTFEYQGNAPKLVHTPLTDRCYLTLTQGMKMGFGGNPYGPAGTGKTESVKALASCLGRQVLVFNCDEALESASMVRIFIGIVKCGAWGCFDEFNRLKEDQLSAISQQIQVIQDAIKTRSSPITLLGRSIDVNYNSGIFVTLNPAGKGYGGRSRLPDNLKALFRPVAMGAPDNELIAEVSLVTEGFTQSKALSSKIVSLFKLSRQLLSLQQHYDWGLRALKAVLNSGGRLIQQYKVEGVKVTSELEYEILIKAVRVNTLSKLTFQDTAKFLALIGDVFPGVKSADITGGELEEAIKNVMKEKPFYLVEDSSQIKKMIQLKESLDQRMGCVIVGPSGCGKSTLWRVLKAAMIKCGQPVVTYVMNPKSMPRERLLGHMDMDTHEWSDGVLTDAARKVVKESLDVRCWIICDGDVDPEWIESLNSVLDDNHLLTLPNGERINFGPNVNFLFETHDLRFASPATVSRMGMIFLSDDDLDVGRVVQKWLSAFPNDRRIALTSWIDEFFYKALDFVLKTGELIVETTLVGIVMNGLSQVRDANSRLEFAVGLIRGLGGNLSLAQRSNLAKELYQLASERPPDLGAPLDCYAEGNSLRSYAPPHATELDAIQVKDIGYTAVIPTVSVQRTLSLVDGWIDHMEPFILVGPEGCGKSMLINHAFRRRKNIGIATINCNAQTSADDVISKIAQTCSLYSSADGRVYRPRDCDRLVLYLKDINLPRPDRYDTCQLIAFLQQIITFGGFYNEELEFLRLERTQIVASMNAATTVGRHPLSTRFTATVRVGVVDYPETNELVAVYENFLETILKSVHITDARWIQPTERERLAGAIVEMYQKIREKFTVDERRHYLFTPRDMTLLVKNIVRYNHESENLLDVLAHEACRIFRDRLVDGESTNRFDQILAGVLRTQFRHPLPSIDAFYTSLNVSKSGGAASSNKKSEGKDSSGDEVDTKSIGGLLMKLNESEFKKLVSQGILYYEREERDLNMLLFTEILEQVARVDRVLSSPNGHLLLVGKSGVGRRNAVTLATYMLTYHFLTPSITRDYGAKQFAVDVKIALDLAGNKGEQVVLFIEDFQITKESILETINSLICSGEAPGLYTHEELEPILANLRKYMEEDAGDARTPYEFFVQRIRKNLHIALCMDPAHPQFLYRCESNPALYGQCSVLWIGEWRSQSLKEIPLLMDGIREIIVHKPENDDAGIVARNEGKSSGRNEGKSGRESKAGGINDHDDIGENEPKPDEALVDMVISLHDSCQSLGATPKDYISLLKSWHSLYNLKKKELLVELGHLEAGLNKLDSAAEVVHDLRTNAAQQEKDLRVAQVAADRAMEEISKAIASSTDRRNEVGEIKRTVAENEEKTQARKSEIENELAEIQPILDAAKTAVGGIRSDHLNEIRSLAAPPEAIADVLAAVLMLLGVQDLSWQSMKKFLGNRGVKEDILNFDAKRISDDLRRNVAKLLKKKSSSFDDANIQRVSVAAAPMAAWVKANIRYSLVIEKIEPLQHELEEEISKLEQSQKRLKRCEEELQEIDDRVATLKKEFGARTAEAERLKNNLAIAGTTLDKAEKLIGQLGGEQQRWKTQAKTLRGDLAKLPMKMLLAAGFVTYLAKTSEDIRSSMITRWMDLTSISSFIFKRVMSTESELLQWKSMTLPSDDLSQENGLVITLTNDRTPFIIDPASAALGWLKTILAMDKTRPLEVITQFDQRFMNHVELAVRFGKTLLVVESDGLEPALYPLCRRDLCHQGPRNIITIGEKTIDFNDNFRMLLITRNPSPEIPPDAAALLTIVNFTVTRSGLEGQLLGLAIQHEQPELEKAKGEMLKKEEDFKVQLAKLEKDLLETLATAEGNLLENTSLIESLTRTKEKSAEIEDALVKSADASIKLDQQREVYRHFALSSAKLYFLVKNLQNISHMYQFSLSSFITLFKSSLKAEVSAKSTEERLNLLVGDMEVRVLYFVGRAIFKADRPMFALHLVRGMHPDYFQPREWEIFTGSLVASVSEAIPRGYPNWAPSERKDAYRLLTEQLPELVKSLELENTAKWQRFATSVEAERDLPALRGITPFQKVLILQAFRPDRLQSAILEFCMQLLKVESISPPPISLATLFDEIDAHTPLLLISSPGADASKELQEYAARTIGLGRYEELAMGGGQQDIAIEMLKNAANNGTWLCLKNLHLVISWLPKLEKELAALQSHDEFRLILTSESHHQFTSILLQQSLKATFESPPGIKKNLQRTFDSWDNSELFENASGLRARMLFLLACFHAIMQERRTYIPQGWTKFYEFSYGDLKAGSYVIEAVTKKNNRDLDWEIVHGLMEDAIYGGRIDNAYDIRVLRAYLSLFFSDRLAGEDGGGKEILTGTPLRMPNHPEYKSFVKIISQLPDVDAPYIFCLPDNIERSLQRTNSTTLIRQLRVLSTADAEVSKYDREKWRTQLGPILDLWQQMTSSTPGLITRKLGSNGGSNASSSSTAPGKKPTQSIHDPIDDFVMMESDLSGDICGVVDMSLSGLKKVLFGSGLLTPVIQTVATALLADQVPSEWKRLWESSPEKPQGWLRELIRKRISLNKWKQSLSKGGSMNLLSTSLCINDLFNPGTFINALRQQTARKLNTAIDMVKLVCAWDKDFKRMKQDCPLPCILSNLLLQGASFQGGLLQESVSEASELTPISDVCIGFILKSSPDTYQADMSVTIPIYLTPTREDFLMELQMPIGRSGDQDRWILSGISMFLSEED